MWDSIYKITDKEFQEIDTEIYSLLKDILGGMEDFDYISPDMKYSRNVADAFFLVDSIGVGADMGFSLFKYPILSSYGVGYVAVFAKALRPISIDIINIGDPARVFHSHSDSLSLAVAKAALLALRSEAEKRKNHGK